MKAATVCSGIGSPEVAAPWIDWRWTAETDKHACTVLAARHPGLRNLGDMTRITADAVEPVDLLVAGTPCQDFSVAGLRAGLAGERGNLTLEFVRLLGVLKPRWFVLENVPGLLSMDEGRAFGAILGAVAKLGYGFAYRVLDAQYAGVPQRQRAHGLRVRDVRRPQPPRRGLRRQRGRHRARGTPLIVMPLQETGKRTGASSTSRKAGDGLGNPDDPMFTLGADSRHAIAFDCKAGGKTAFTIGDTPGTMRARPDGNLAVAFKRAQIGKPYDRTNYEPGQAGTLSAYDPESVAIGAAVRRLTPRECERLQGFPDDYTLVPYGTKLMADGPRYRMLGNAMAIPVISWVLSRVGLVDAQLRAGEAA
jgi:DNA (cytosine-5)-methyltransferase 1